MTNIQAIKSIITYMSKWRSDASKMKRLLEPTEMSILRECQENFSAYEETRRHKKDMHCGRYKLLCHKVEKEMEDSVGRPTK